MDLFVINRYTGDEKPVDLAEKEKDEQEKLSKIQKRIEKSKRTRERQKEKKEFVRNKILKRKTEIEKKNFTLTLRGSDKKLLSNDIDDLPKKKSKAENVALEGFTILGKDGFQKKEKIKRVLPNWLSNPHVISVDLQNLQSKVSGMKQLNKDLRNKLKNMGIKYFFPVQAEVIPWLLQNNKIKHCVQPQDICVSAPTGSGKTLTFVLPIVQSLLRYTTRKVRALVILPTRDLAVQVFKAFKKFTDDTNINVAVITGTTSFSNEQELLVTNNHAFGYISKVDILVCTPGRMVDHLKLTPGFSLQHLEYIIIDEADRVLENIKDNWINHLEKHITRKDSTSIGLKTLNLISLQTQRSPQKLLFSATLSQDPEKLQILNLFQPKLFTSIVEKTMNEGNEEITDRFIGKYTTPKELTEKYIICKPELKPLVLYDFIKTNDLKKVLVFAHSGETTHRLHILLKRLFKGDRSVEDVGSYFTTSDRSKIINEFEAGNIDVLVSTDTWARGLDLNCVKCVVSYSAPKFLKTYIHRIGRTARAGEDGLAVTLIQNHELSRFKELLKQASKDKVEEINIEDDKLNALQEEYKEALSQLQETVSLEHHGKMQRNKARGKFNA